MAIASGASLVVEHSFIFLGDIFKRIRETGTTVLPGVPTVYAMMVSTYKRKPFQFERINKITNTGAALPNDHIPTLKQIFPNARIYKMYGLTECKRVCYLDPDKKPMSVGKAIPGTETFILNDEGKQVRPHEPGMLYVRGPHVMAGYWNNEERTRKMIKPGLLPGEQILCTNDIFKCDEEGYLYFVGRTDDIIKTRGEKVSPLEVENVLNGIDKIKEAVVIGVPDAVMGQSIKAFVSVVPGAAITAKDIRTHCFSLLEYFMVPRDVVILDELPKSPNGKIDKRSLTDFEKLQSVD
jgi:acyl-coenzyme A synthetase/AMP-(fatty) acid ligase